MLYVFRSISYDFIVLEVKYCKNCYFLYILKKDFKVEECNFFYEVFFQEFVVEIIRGICEGKVYDIIIFFIMYQSNLESKGVDVSNYFK